MRCPFMIENADVIREAVAEAPAEQRAAARAWSREFKDQGGDITRPRDRAYFVVGWLKRLGEEPLKWGSHGDGPRVQLLRRKIENR